MLFRNDIQILRGVAVLFVLLFHLEVAGFASGFLGVDVFFVISGYLMALLFDEGNKKHFYARRIKRLVPPYLVTVIATLAITSYLTVPADFAQSIKQSLFAAGFSSNIGFWLQSSYFSKAEFNPLLNLWSLGLEMQFYLVIPFLYAYLKPRKRMTLVVMALSFGACLLAATISPKTAFFHMPFRVWEFLIGAYIAWNMPGKAQGTELERALFPLLLVAALLTPLRPNTMILGMDPGLTNLTVCLLAGAILTFGLPSLLEKNWVGKGLAFIGRYSYAIYLAHFPAIVLFNYIPFGGTVLGFKDIPALLQILALTLLSAATLYHLVERNTARIFKGRRPFVFAALAAILAVAAATPHNTDYTQTQKNIFAAWTDQGIYRCGKLFRLLNPMASVCQITEGNRRLLLVGNSHADAMKQSLSHVLHPHDVALYLHVANDPLMEERWNSDTVFKDVTRLNIDAVIVHFDINHYNQHLIDEINRLGNHLVKAGIPMRLISPVPTYSIHVPRHMLTQPDDPRLTQDISHYYQRNRAFWDNFPNATIPADHILDAGKIFCTPECAIADADSHPYYFDTDHMTLTGARLLEPPLEVIAEEWFGS